MAYVENEARRLIIEAGHRLVAEGLIARTWGNISARISDEQFVITPSGRGYEDLKESDLAVVSIKDCKSEGDIKPSSEKGVHADGYRLRKDVDFIIHTHQFYATAVGAAGESIKEPRIPCAAYGMPSTKKLRRAVAKAVADNPKQSAVLMMRHGALCLGKTYEDAFGLAAKLERDCRAIYESKAGQPRGTATADLGSSERSGDCFTLVVNGESFRYDIADVPEDAPRAAFIHAAIYAATDAAFVLHSRQGETVEISKAGKTLYPVADDLAQIAGVSLHCVEPKPEKVAAALRGRDAVLIKGMGALCIGGSLDDAEAVDMILRKDCAAARYLGSLRGMSPADAALQRFIYVKKYSKRKGGA